MNKKYWLVGFKNTYDSSGYSKYEYNIQCKSDNDNNVKDVWLPELALTKEILLSIIDTLPGYWNCTKCFQILQELPIFDEEVKLASVRKDGLFLQWIKDPSYDVCMEAVRQNPNAIQWIKDPNKEIQLLAISKDSSTSKFIKNPCIEAQVAAVKDSAENIELIKNACNEAIIEAITQDIKYIYLLHSTDNEKALLDLIDKDYRYIYYVPNASVLVQLKAFSAGADFKYINGPSRELQLAAVKHNGCWIRYIKNPTLEVQEEALRRNKYAYKYIDIRDIHPRIFKLSERERLVDEKITSLDKVSQLDILKNNPLAIRYIENPSPEMQMVAVKRNSYSLNYISNPTLEAQLQAISQDEAAIRWIKNPCEEVQIAAINKNHLAITFLKKEDISKKALEASGKLMLKMKKENTLVMKDYYPSEVDNTASDEHNDASEPVVTESSDKENVRIRLADMNLTTRYWLFTESEYSEYLDLSPNQEIDLDRDPDRWNTYDIKIARNILNNRLEKFNFNISERDKGYCCVSFGDAQYNIDGSLPRILKALLMDTLVPSKSKFIKLNEEVIIEESVPEEIQELSLSNPVFLTYEIKKFNLYKSTTDAFAFDPPHPNKEQLELAMAVLKERLGEISILNEKNHCIVTVGDTKIQIEGPTSQVVKALLMDTSIPSKSEFLKFKSQNETKTMVSTEDSMSKHHKTETKSEFFTYDEITKYVVNQNDDASLWDLKDIRNAENVLRDRIGSYNKANFSNCICFNLDGKSILIPYTNLAEELISLLKHTYIYSQNKILQRTAFNSLREYNKIKEICKDKESQLAAVKEDAHLIQHIKNPDKDVQLAAVNKDGNSIQWMKNSDKEIQLAAVNQDGYSIDFINNPDKDVQLAAVKQNGESIQFIENPNKDVQLAAVNQNGLSIQHIKNPDKDVQLAAVNQDAHSIKYRTDHLSTDIETQLTATSPDISPDTTESTVTKKEETKMEKNQSAQNDMFSFAKECFNDGLWRSVADNTVTHTKDVICKVLKKKGADEGTLQFIGIFLDSKEGEALVAGLLAVLLNLGPTYMPGLPEQIKNDKRIQRLAKEYGTKASADGISVIYKELSAVAFPIMMQLMTDLKSLPEVEPSSSARLAEDVLGEEEEVSSKATSNAKSK